MPSKTITALSVLSICMLVAYVACIATAMFFATVRTELSASVRQVETRVGALETDYYDAITRLNAMDVTSIGYVTPDDVEYVALDGSPTVTRANR